MEDSATLRSCFLNMSPSSVNMSPFFSEQLQQSRDKASRSRGQGTEGHVPLRIVAVNVRCLETSWIRCVWCVCAVHLFSESHSDPHWTHSSSWGTQS